MLLTPQQSAAIIPPKPATHLLDYSYRSMGRFQTRKSKGVGYTPLGVWLFLCPKSILSKLKNLPLWWGGWLERYSLYTASETNFLLHRQKYQTLRGGLSLSKGDSHMTNRTQKLTNSVSKKSQSRFNVLTRSGRSIARKVLFTQAVQLKNQSPAVLIKFDSMERIA